MIPKIIISGDVEEIKKYISNLLINFSVSPFDISSIGENDSSIKIEKIRELKQKLSLKPFSGKKKATIIYHAENLTTEAQNAMLKILEEPPEDTIILLTTSNENLLLPTIISRCEIVRLKSGVPSPKSQINSKSQIQKSTRVDPQATGVNQNAASIENIRKMDKGQRFKLVEELCKKLDKDEPLENIRKRAEKWLDEILKEMQKSLVTEKNIAQKIRLVLHAKQQIKQNLNIKLVLENLLINL